MAGRKPLNPVPGRQDPGGTVLNAFLRARCRCGTDVFVQSGELAKPQTCASCEATFSVRVEAGARGRRRIVATFHPQKAAGPEAADEPLPFPEGESPVAVPMAGTEIVVLERHRRIGGVPYPRWENLLKGPVCMLCTCGMGLRITRDLLGKTVQCPECRQTMVPEGNASRIRLRFMPAGES